MTYEQKWTRTETFRLDDVEAPASDYYLQYVGNNEYVELRDAKDDALLAEFDRRQLADMMNGTRGVA